MKYISTSIILILLSLVGCNNANPEKIIINQKYTGNIIIIHNQPDGVNIKQDGREILKIPESGILKVKSPINEGWQNQVAYSSDINGILKKVPIYSFTGLKSLIKEGKVDTTVPALYGGSVGFSSSYSNEVECKVGWTHYIFGTYNQISKYPSRGELSIHELLKEKDISIACKN